MNYIEKYIKYKKKYLNLKYKMQGGAIESIDESELSDVVLITSSGGGDIYRAKYKEIIYAYKKINERELEHILKNLREIDDKIVAMSRFPNLIVPLFMVKNGDKVNGYLMRLLDGYSTLGDIVSSLDINRFIKILNKICDGFINMYSCGVVPCPEHSENIMVNDVNDVVFIDLDDVVKCNGNDQQTTLNQLNIIFMNVPLILTRNVHFRKIFNVNAYGDVELKRFTPQTLKSTIVRIGEELRIEL
jgi:hypothetical protein